MCSTVIKTVISVNFKDAKLKLVKSKKILLETYLQYKPLSWFVL